MNICTYTYEEYLHLVKSFHGSLAPGLIIGGFIVDLALKHLPEGELFDALCETPVCLPDAVQILTPCTIGNGWLTVFDIGRFAVTMYEKKGGQRSGFPRCQKVGELARNPGLVSQAEEKTGTEL